MNVHPTDRLNDRVAELAALFTHIAQARMAGVLP